MLCNSRDLQDAYKLREAELRQRSEEAWKEYQREKGGWWEGCLGPPIA